MFVQLVVCHNLALIKINAFFKNYTKKNSFLSKAHQHLNIFFLHISNKIKSFNYIIRIKKI